MTEHTTYTPGPWMASGLTVYAVDQLRVGVAYMASFADTIKGHEHRTASEESMRSEPEAIANARLMAAAPDLLDALQRAHNFYTDGFDGDPQERSILKAAHAAIRKATTGD